MFWLYFKPIDWFPFQICFQNMFEIFTSSCLQCQLHKKIVPFQFKICYICVSNYIYLMFNHSYLHNMCRVHDEIFILTITLWIRLYFIIYFYRYPYWKNCTTYIPLPLLDSNFLKSLHNFIWLIYFSKIYIYLDMANIP
jgi:hypothetical protein